MSRLLSILTVYNLVVILSVSMSKRFYLHYNI